MKKYITIIVSLAFLPIGISMAGNDITNLLSIYKSKDTVTGNAEQGRQLWQKKFIGKGEFAERSCVSCHTKDLALSGKHVKTNKAIKPMAPAINPERLTDAKKVEKWFKRNCKWTMGRECSSQEKIDLLVYINSPSNF